MSDLIRREDVLMIIEARFSEMMIGDILKKDVETLPEAAVRSGDRISRCELFNRLATITGEDANDMKAKIYAVIQEMDPVPAARQGSWEVRPAPEDDRVLGRKRYYCSECGGWNTYGESDFCPRCGADMRSGSRQEETVDCSWR